MTKSSFEQTIVFLHTADLQTTARFYEDVLGLELARDQGVCRIYQISNDGYIGFCEHIEPSKPQGVILTLVSAEVDNWYQRLQTQGVKTTKIPTYNPEFGIYHCFFEDPNGYLLEIQRFDKPL